MDGPEQKEPVKPPVDIWVETLSELQLHDPEGQHWQAIARHYHEDHRHYHNLEHVGTCLEHLARTEANTPALRLALVYHDVIYDTQRNDNEEASAAMARNDLIELGAAKDLIETVAGLILCTDHSGKHPALPHCDLLCDIDLSTLGASDQEYDRYAQNIRREYDWVSEENYREGRSKILSAFLQHSQIDSTPDLRSRFEENARANLRRELKQLA